MSEKKTPVLEVKELGIDFGGLTAVNDLDLAIYNEEIVGLIGPNGAGKTTVFNLLTKVYTPTRGSIFFDGKDTAGKTVVDINKAGIARTFQNIRLFDNLTVLDNVKTGYHNNIKYSPVSAVFRLPGYYAKEREIEGKSRELLEIMELGQYADVTAGNLPYGAQRRLEIARAMATEPKLLLLDEPAADRARHAACHGNLRTHLCSELRHAAGPGPSRRDSGKSRGHQGLPGRLM